MVKGESTSQHAVQHIPQRGLSFHSALIFLGGSTEGEHLAWLEGASLGRGRLSAGVKASGNGMSSVLQKFLVLDRGADSGLGQGWWWWG